MRGQRTLGARGRIWEGFVDTPFRMDEMDRAIAYELKREQALAF
jgi:hypothetical protein